MNPAPVDIAAALVFALALAHTFGTRLFDRLAQRSPRHAGLWHLLGEVEVVFGLWAAVLLLVLAWFRGPAQAIDYAESRQYTEPLFVFVVMVVAASRPVLVLARRATAALARRLPWPRPLATTWLALSLVPLAGSVVTEPAAMTLAALILGPLVFRATVAEPAKYAVLGTLFVNVSIGGTLTAYAAPPVLMVAAAWQWDTAFMAAHFGWKAALAVLVNASVTTLLVRRQLAAAAAEPGSDDGPAVPWTVTLVHLGFLATVVALAHHPALFLGIFLFFLGYTQAYARWQGPLILKEALLVAFFLAGLVLLGGMQSWWLQPVVAGLQPTALFFGALALTAVTDNAALTYLGSLIVDITPPAQYALVAGAVSGGGLTVIANAPNPAGAALLRQGFRDGAVGALGLLAGAAVPTVVAALAFQLP